MDSDQEKNEKIEAVYREYLAKIQVLKDEQDRIMKEFMAELEKAKIEEIRKKMTNG